MLTFIFAIPIFVVPECRARLEMQLRQVDTTGHGCHRIMAIVPEITCFGPYWKWNSWRLVDAIFQEEL